MGKEIEIEMKQLLTKKQFDTLCQAFQIEAGDFALQTNYYFDTPAFSLKKLRMALRIREKNGSFTLTLKEPHQDGILETNQRITREAAMKLLANESFIDGEVKDALANKRLPLRSIQYLGKIQTNRAEIRYNEGILVFDHSSYLDTEDYELEYEVSDKEQGIKEFSHLLQQYSIPYEQSEPKIKRFFNRAAQQ